ncbi:MAG: hypothetical protein A2V70_15835 [Planctomycetes bacterium RBG_13_63_9]|nr:MAG: hypothetical protein A2V70_15835 [Planctomycetes bacterium RBG_13_63_9]
MNRREFISVGGATLLGAAAMTDRVFGQEPNTSTGSGITWRRHQASRLFDRVGSGGQPLIHEEGVGVLDGFCRMIEDAELGGEVFLGCEKPKGECGPVRLSLTHRLDASKGGSNQDLLEATLTLTNTSERPCEVLAGFLSGVRPCRDAADQQIYVPICAQGMNNRPDQKHLDCHQAVGSQGYLAHYMEPQASDPRPVQTRALLLAPVVDVFADGGPCRMALFASSLEPLFFQALEGPSSRAWRMGRRVRLDAGQSLDLKAYLLLHPGDASEAWTALHRFAHKEDFAPPEWTRQFRANYYDFLSAVEADGRRGGGYDADLKHFDEFHVGMATQHGYYLTYGDFIHPDRKQWPAMPRDPKGPVTMSLEKIQQRVEATRRAGVRAMIYMHFVALDEGSPLFEKLKDAIQVDSAGNQRPFGWMGPDVITKTWRMSTTAPAWRDHFLQQTQWIMELFDPDGIVIDETFCGFGYDHHPQHGGSQALASVELMRKTRALLRSFGPDKALFASDCSMANFVMWGDAEGGDHCYDRLLGNPLYRQQPVRYTAALGQKAWQPCAWLFKSLWPMQMDLARKTGAGVGLTNGWGDNIGLARLPQPTKRQMIRDIESLPKA